MSLLISLILQIFMCFQTPPTSGGGEEDISTATLRRLDLSNDSILNRILEEVTDPVRYGDSEAYYTFNSEPYRDGVMIRIERSTSDVFEKRQHPYAYVEVNGRLIVFYNTRGLKLPDTKEKAPLTIKTARLDDFEYVTDIMFYYILGDVYAKFSPEAGWLWSDGSTDE